MATLPPRRFPFLSLVVVLGGVGLHALFLQAVLENRVLAGQWFSGEMWSQAVEFLGGQVELPTGKVPRPVGLGRLLAVLSGVTVVCWLLGALWIGRSTGIGWREAAGNWGRTGWAWWWLPGAWEVLRILAVLSGWTGLEELLISIVSLVEAAALAGWVSSLVAAIGAGGRSFDVEQVTPASRRAWLLAVLLAITYTLVATVMNWDRYDNLLVPHGDSAMYEEHLWNTWHGKGFRSYLDDGRLFLGEHFQVIHLLLSPLYWLWSSHRLLELCESAALGAAALAVFRLARRESGSGRVGLALAASFLLAFPVHFLDIAIDGKTFRPVVLGVPLLLWALDQWDAGHRRRAALLLVLSLLAKEDFALVIAPLGLWLAVWETPDPEDRRSTRLWGLGICVASIVWLLLVLLVLIPAFRGGVPHYARYFGELGSSPGEILATGLSHPGLLLGKWFSSRSIFYALALLLPIGFLPLLSRGRLAVCLPIFAMLCLLEFGDAISGSQAVIPFHHFHAPLIPVLYWTAAHGAGRLARSGGPALRRGIHLAWTAAIATGFFYSTGPLGIAFWDSHSTLHGETLHETGLRAKLFARVESSIPRSARVFSTDFVHPRFTHHERSYDYSKYPRHSNRELTHPVPGQQYYIVIDTQHPYSTIKSLDDVSEWKTHPRDWRVDQLVRDDEGTIYFIVLKRGGS